ncbi:MAG: rod shape-determining protein MreD [Leptolyngbya sp. SIO4C1]|nr:rod shape-determining protein MreD [Leptolyngbya sp. SIO4C1]
MTFSRRRRQQSEFQRSALNWCVTIGSVFLCLLILPTRLPGTELLGISPNWLLIWVVAWSVNRIPFDGAIAGLVLGLLQDALTAHFPTHALSLMVVGYLTGRLQKQRYIQEDIVSVALIVFGMAVVAETVMALQISAHYLLVPSSPYPSLGEIWLYQQKAALSSAILSSLWAPALYYPLKRWWEQYQPRELD